MRRALPGGSLILALLPSCGRPATAEECDEIVGRIAELELRESGGGDPAEVAAKVVDAKKQFQAEARSRCVGKRITEGALRCVQGAKTADEIVKRCLD